MREFIITEAKSEEAVLVGLITKNQNEEQAREYLDELDFLSSTAGVRAVRRFTQRLDQAHSVTFVGKGKLCLLYTSPSPRDATLSRMPSSA